MKLKELLSNYECENMPDLRALDKDILGITSDSRLVEPGFLFAALPGENVDGRDFILHAARSGAVAVLTADNILPEIDNTIQASFILDTNPRKRYAELVGKFYKPQPQHVVAVTGTNGKSSVAEFTRQIWQICELPSASIGTLGLVTPWKIEGGHLTTPDPIDLHKTLLQLTKGGVEHVVLEASSHGLSQFRVDGIDLEVAAFTNLSREHLDYHKTMEKYFKEKCRLFTEVLNPEGVAVINSDDKMAVRLSEILKERNISCMDFGTNANDLILKNTQILSYGQKLSLSVFGREFDVILSLIGSFQSMNVLCALAIVIASGVDPEKAIRTMSKLNGVKGRMELAAFTSDGSRIFVDYAHTPDAIKNVLNSLRLHTSKKLKIVFGCGGNRDHGKRQQMGKIASELADEVIITDDNPRFENAAKIRTQIKSASPGAIEIADRMEAITAAIKSLSSGDILIIAGKGHEKGQIINGTELPFDDVEAVKTAVRCSL